MARLTAPLEAAIAVLGERASEHGDYVQLHHRIATLWSAYLEITVQPEQVAAMQLLLKLARSETGPGNPDNLVDLAGYTAIYAALAKSDRHSQPVSAVGDGTGASTPDFL